MRPTWDEYFMAIAAVASSRSSCNHVRAGAVIVLDKRIISTGYNGAPCGVTKSCVEAGCNKENLGVTYENSLNTGRCIGVHAEMNALANLSRGIHKGATLYITVFPCPSCAKNLMAYNIKRVVYKRKYNDAESSLSRALLEQAGITIEQLDIGPRRLRNILFNLPNVDFDVFSDTERKEHGLKVKSIKCVKGLKS